ncbi:MAG: hypothetical protein WDM78_17870 [Puia sp.]
MRKAANAVNLIYVRDNMPGIQRLKKGKGFIYIMEDQTLNDHEELKRIKKTGHSASLDGSLDLPSGERSYPGNRPGYPKKKTIPLS